MTISSQTIEDAVFLSEKVYEETFGAGAGNTGGGIGNGWHLVSRQELGLTGIVDWTYFNGEYLYDNFNSQAFVAQKGNTLALVFRGCNEPIDYPDAAFFQVAHYNQFNKVISAC
jgi:hypothetical protein